MAGLTVYKDNGQMLFDTTKISYGLVKSGYMTFQQSWSRRGLRSAQLDPGEGTNWTPVQNVAQDKGDNLFGFTLTNARNPIVFLVGSGTLNGSQRIGDTITFLYSNATSATRYYCFDLMADNFVGTPFLKIYNQSGALTFNSLQPPLNIIGQYTAPPPDPRTQGGRIYLTYLGGRTQRRQLRVPPNYPMPQADCIYDVPLSPGVEYAAFLPWSRGGGIMDFSSGDSGDAAAYGVVEGAYGRTGGISFMFGASAGTTDSRAMAGGGVPAGISYSNIATDRYPTALIIQTAGLPLPFN
ncbi:hypothetical protein POF45_22205 [Pseudomonas sp. 681]|uniref:Phage tail protein n=1 Tax=Pseudomonas fungipugnans TaxID=3024217 RepID=A0ABT6QV97_9PSED|nr:hypothetical protein [Pseudomonas sp. 681]MDI2594122.1 hypothetical protein [Pseudomonas sp. 681]